MTIQKNSVAASISFAAQIIVRSRGGKWHIQCSDENLVFSQQTPAVTAAIRLAHENGKNGSPSCVVLMKRKTPTIIWTYGVDPYPPTIADIVPVSNKFG